MSPPWHRLRRLEREHNGDCPLCSVAGLIEFEEVTADQGEPAGPTRCPHCGNVPPVSFIEIVLVDGSARDEEYAAEDVPA